MFTSGQNVPPCTTWTAQHVAIARCPQIGYQHLHNPSSPPIVKDCPSSPPDASQLFGALSFYYSEHLAIRWACVAFVLRLCSACALRGAHALCAALVIFRFLPVWSVPIIRHWCQFCAAGADMRRWCRHGSLLPIMRHFCQSYVTGVNFATCVTSANHTSLLPIMRHFYQFHVTGLNYVPLLPNLTLQLELLPFGYAVTLLLW